MAITEPAQFTTEKLKQAYQATVFIDCDDQSKYWSNELLASFNGHAYENDLVNISAISATIDRDGGLATVGGLTIDLSNLEDYSDWLQGSGDISKSVCKFYIVFNDGTTIQFSESVQFFTGLIDDIEINYDMLSISVAHQDLFYNEMVGELITEDEYTNQLKESIGKMKPIVYGYHTYNGSKPNAAWNPLESANMVPAIQVSNNTFVISNHELGSIDTDDIWVYNPSLGRYLNVNSDMVTITNPDGSGDCIVTFSSGTYLEVYDFWQPETVQDRPDGSWSDIDNAIDKNLNTYAAETTSAYSMLTFDFPDYDYNNYQKLLDVEYFSAYNYTGGLWIMRESHLSYSTRLSYITNIVHVAGTCTVTTNQPHQGLVGEVVEINGVLADFAIGTGPMDINGAHVIVTVPDSTSFTVEFTTSQTYYYGGSCTIAPQEAFDLTETTYGTPTSIGSSILFTHQSIGSQAYIFKEDGDASTINVRCLFKRIKLGITIGSDFKVAASCYGKNDGGYIRNPVDIMDDLVDTYTSLASSDFDSTAFTTAQTARSSWVCDPIFTEQDMITNHIQNLGKASNVFAFWNNANKLKLVAYTQGASASLTANVDEFSETPGVTSGAFDKNEIKYGTYLQKQVQVDKIANKVNIDFSYDAVAGRFQARDVMENETSQAIYGVFEKSFINKYIIDETTMGYYAANMIDILSYKNWLSRFTAAISAFNTEIGDVIDIDNFIDGDIKWLVTSVAHKPLDGCGWIDIEAIELKDTSGDTITETVTEWGLGEAIVGSGSGSLGIGGSGGFDSVKFTGQQTGNELIEGVVGREIYGRPVYIWVEVDEDGWAQTNASLEHP